MVHPGDTVHTSNQSRTSNKMERSRKKVEWSSNLSSVESAAPEDRSPNWDNETGHLLSYFLGGEHHQNGGTASPLTQFTTTSGSLPGILQNGKESSNHPYGGGACEPQPGFVVSASDSYHSVADDDDHDYAPPPTPATQYYHHSTKSQAQAGRPPTHSMGRSSNSSMSSSAPGFKTSIGVRNAPHASSDQTMDSTSPLSPILLIGAGHEPLMLPPSPRGAQEEPQSQKPRQSHLEWLQHINNLAQQANASQATSAGYVPAASMAAPGPTMHTAAMAHTTTSQSMGYPGVAGLPMAYGHPPMFFTPAALKHLQNHSPPVESEEKRAKRLERNRESARKSRLRKKERLSKLEEQVSGLHDKIEAARTIQIKDMNPRLHDFFLQRVMQLHEVNESGVSINSDALVVIFRGAGHNCEVQRAAIDFQYSKLKRHLLPRYQKFLLWLTLHQDSWFTAGKEQYTQREASMQSLRISSGKISSKQVGDELTNGPKTSEDEGAAGKKKSAKARREQAAQTAEAFDPLRMWPLLCFELSISVDQEERLLHALKVARLRQDIQDNRSQIEAAARMASRLKEAVLLQSHNVAVRAGRAYLDVLNPNQSVAFHKWIANNRERCQDALKRKACKEQARALSQMEYSSVSENMTLIEVCRKLEAVLKISKGEN